MIVKTDAADQFVRRPPPNVVFFLVYGNDEGLIRERAGRLVSAALGDNPDPLRLARLDGETLAQDPGRLSDEARAVSMFGGSRIVWIDSRGGEILTALKPLFQAPPTECTIIVEASPLKKRSALWNAFAGQPNGAMIECYLDNRRAIAAVIEEEASAGRLRVPPDVREALSDLLGADRMTTRNEVAKLMLYARGRGEVTEEDVEAIVSEAAPSMLDEAVDAAFGGDARAADKIGRRYLANGGEASVLLGAAIRRAALLHRLRAEIDSGGSFEGAMESAGARFYFQRRAALERQVHRWTAARLAKLFTPLHRASAWARETPTLAEATSLRALWAVASSGRSGGAPAG